jgi:hypothetical protein
LHRHSSEDMFVVQFMVSLKKMQAAAQKLMTALIRVSAPTHPRVGERPEVIVGILEYLVQSQLATFLVHFYHSVIHWPIKIMSQANGSSESNGVDNGQLGSELWRHPAPERTQMWDFLQTVNKEQGLELRNYNHLYNWSIDKVPEFWAAVSRFVGIKASAPHVEVSHYSLAETKMLYSTCT